MGERKSRWVIVTPTGDQLVFSSLSELQEALMGNEQGEDDQEHMRVSTCDLEPSQAFAAAQRHVVAGRAGVAMGVGVAGRGTPSPYQNTLAGIPLPQHVMAAAGVRTTNLGGFSPAGQGAHEMRAKSVAASGDAPSGAALLRNTPVPSSGPRGRVRLRRTTPAGLFAPPANPQLPAPRAANDLDADWPHGGRGPSGTKPGLVAPAAPAPQLPSRTYGYNEMKPRWSPPPHGEGAPGSHEPPPTRRLPRFASASPTCPGLYPLTKTRTSPGLHPGRAANAAPARLEPLPPVPVAAPMRPRATPSPSGEPSLDSVDAIWAAMLQSTSKFVPFPMPPRGASPQPVDMAAQQEAQNVDDGWASVADMPALPPRQTPQQMPPRQTPQQMPPMQQMPVQQMPIQQLQPMVPVALNEPVNPFMKGSEKALLEAYPANQTPPHAAAAHAARIAQGWAPPPMPVPPPLPPGYAYEGQGGVRDQGGFRPQGWQEQGGGAWQEEPGAYPDQASYPEPSGNFGDYRNVVGQSDLDLNALPMPPPSLPVRSRSQSDGPDLSEAMRSQIPSDEAPRYSVPSLDDRDSSSSASMPLMHEQERRFPRWWFPLIAAAGFGVGVLLVVGREGPPSRAAAVDAPAKASASQVQETKPAAPPPQVVATATSEPAPVAPAPAPTPIAPTPVAVNDRPAEPPSVGTSAVDRRPEPVAATPAKVIELGPSKTDKVVEKTEKTEKTTEKTEKPAEASAEAAGEPGATPVKLEGKSNYDKAVNAQRAGDYARARTLYRQVAEKDPHNFEAQTGLGDVARAMGEKQEAILAYRRALAENPSFYPALLGLADVLWETGDKTAATERYAEIAKRFSPSMYPNRVRERVSGGETP
ncbi:tetratricopeptide repeat protein [Pendulispora brunnea]|uniref:Tetratricopeptide repeat protein n=1 Tax=Pendulispora brunnea TaxID=2905690 RepID=A0ABZ2KJM8_9BACT